MVDLLPLDAVRVQPGVRVLVEQWGGDRTLAARVRRVEPSGFTKVSALGVEEQRVNVILECTDAAEAWMALGDGYRVEARIVTWESADVLKVPTAALIRVGAQWAVYVVRDGRAAQATATPGHPARRPRSPAGSSRAPSRACIRATRSRPARVQPRAG